MIDSGAERSVCPEIVAREAGIDLARYPVRRVRGIGGTRRARLCPIDIEILGRRIGTEIFVVETEMVLLGRGDVFRAFQLCFDERAQVVLVEPYDEP